MEPYSNRELDEKFSNLTDLVRRQHDDVMTVVGEVRVQTTYTNGKVTKLMMWRAYITGAVVTLGFITGSIAIPVMSAFIQKGSL